MKGVIRERRDGGVSECKSPESLVGKGRCVHVLGTSLEVEHVQKGLYVVDCEGSNMTINGEKEAISKFFKAVTSINDPEEIKKIINFIEETR